MRALLVAVVVLAACGGREASPAEAPAPVPAPAADAIVAETDGGVATIAVKVWPASPTLGDSIWLRLEATADPGVTVELPFDAGALGRFQVLRYAPDGPTAATYELAAPMSGRHRIPPLRVVVRPADGEPVEVLTEEVPLVVGTVLAARTDRALAPARDDLPTHVGGGVWWPGLVGGVVAAIGAAAALATLLLRKRAVRRAQVSAWDTAMQRLAELEARGAPPADDPAACDAWFVALSGVVRAYVEGRFRLRAPELTTEEFLLAAQRIPELTAGHRELLGSFLERCDRVKFAGWRPAAAESLEVLAAARSFVVDTRPVEDVADAKEAA